MNYRTFVIILASIVAILLAVGVLFLIFTEERSPESYFNPKGTLYLSLIPADKATSSPIGIYTYTFPRGIWNRVLVDDERRDGSVYYANFSSSLSDDGTAMTFVRKEENNESARQIYISSPDGKGIRQITNTAEEMKREPVFNPSKDLIAYVVLNSPLNDLASFRIPESWSTYLSDMSGKVTEVSKGINPMFSRDGKRLLVLKNKGLYMFDISNPQKPTEKGLVIPIVGDGKRASRTMELSLSLDRTKLAWSVPAQNKVFVYDIISWDKFSFELKTIILANKAYWPTFSPDGKALALQEERVSEGGEKYNVVVAYNLDGPRAKKDIVNLENFAIGHIWFDVWQ